jgi:hypothetical protein
MGKSQKRNLLFLVAAVFLLPLIFSLLTLFSPGPLSNLIRIKIESAVNDQMDEWYEKAADGSLEASDLDQIRRGISIGAFFYGIKYPEAASVLKHYVGGEGGTLELKSGYFKKSAALQQLIEDLPPGEHGPLWLKQSDDYRLTLALNPFYISKSSEKIRLFHPQLEFASPFEGKVFTIIKLGKMNFKVYDNLVNAAGGKKFYCFAEWDFELKKE